MTAQDQLLARLVAAWYALTGETGQTLTAVVRAARARPDTAELHRVISAITDGAKGDHAAAIRLGLFIAENAERPVEVGNTRMQFVRLTATGRYRRWCLEEA